MHHIEAISQTESLAILVALHVIRRCATITETIPVGVTKRGKGFEPRHNDSVPSPRTILCDVDGVIWLMRTPLPGAVDAVRRWLDAGHRLMFVTNNSHATLGAQEEAFAEIGIDASGRLLTSSMAAAHLLEAGARVVVNGGPGVIEAVESAGATAVPVESVTEDGAAADGVTDVVVGFHRDFDFRRLHVLSALVREGARLIGTNSDATYPTNRGVIPGGGAILAAVATAGGVNPVIAGKPHETMAKLVTSRLGSCEVEDMWMVGDRLSTDGLFAKRLGCRFAHVRSEVSESGVDVTPDVTVSSFADFVDAALRTSTA